MEITAGQLDWLSTDEENLAKFLDTETGKRFIPKLVEYAPPLHSDGDTNAILIRTGEVRGYQNVVQTILALAHPAPKSTPSRIGYEAPEDDSAWNDGQKLTPVTPKPTLDPLA